MPEAITTKQRSWTPDAQQAMRRGSVSFFLAARLLPGRVRDAITFLYAWCRHCDDVIDGQDLGHGAMADRAVVSGLGPVVASLQSATRAATVDELAQVTPVFAAMGWVCRRYGIPDVYPTELLAGMRMDVDGTVYDTLEDLELYCYRVAGTVGLMFSHIVGVSDTRALRHAVDLGIAMQLTNIARDVATDHAAGRVYLPMAWLREEGLTQETLMTPQSRPALVRMTARLLAAADAHYRSGDSGLAYLPARVALAVAAARHIYAEIGAKVRELGPDAWRLRASVPLYRKLTLVLRAAWQVARTLPERRRHPWQATALADTLAWHTRTSWRTP